MTDIVERLREKYLDTKKMLPNSLCHEAANEIESLRQRAEANARGFSDVNKKLAECQAREEKLRKVFESFDKYSSIYDACLARDKAFDILQFDTTALIEYGKQKQHEALLEVDKVLLEMQGGSVTYCNETIRRMAEALK